MEHWWPGSQDFKSGGHTLGTAWNAEYQDITSRPHYQRMLEWVKNSYHPEYVDSGIHAVMLGDDDRVWDGHHRILIAHVLGWQGVLVEFGGDGPWWEAHLATG